MTVMDVGPSHTVDPDHRHRPEAERFGRGLVFGTLASAALWIVVIAAMIR